MKKTLLALAIAATATSVNAAEIYSNDDTKVGLKGEVDIYLAQLLKLTNISGVAFWEERRRRFYLG